MMKPFFPFMLQAYTFLFVLLCFISIAKYSYIQNKYYPEKVFGKYSAGLSFYRQGRYLILAMLRFIFWGFFMLVFFWYFSNTFDDAISFVIPFEKALISFSACVFGLACMFVALFYAYKLVFSSVNNAQKMIDEFDNGSVLKKIFMSIGI